MIPTNARLTIAPAPNVTHSTDTTTATEGNALPTIEAEIGRLRHENRRLHTLATLQATNARLIRRTILSRP